MNTMLKAEKLSWFTIRKARYENQRGAVVDCVKASSIDVAFQWSIAKWSDIISRSHDASADGSTYNLFVERMTPRTTLTPGSTLILQPTREEVSKFADMWANGPMTLSAEL